MFLIGDFQQFIVVFLFFVSALLHSSVGYAGATTYIAIMTLFSFPPSEIKPTSLILNICVAAITTTRFLRTGFFDKKIFTTFIISSTPLAFIGGYLSVNKATFSLIAGLVLLFSAVLLFLKNIFQKGDYEVKKMPVLAGISLGSLIGFFSGLIGIGGGIFLSPLVILNKWTTIKKAAGTTALFILINSISAIIGHFVSIKQIPLNSIYFVLAVITGSLIGSQLGVVKFNNRIIYFLLFTVLMLASMKFIFIDFFNIKF